jgi:DNA repair exonuclease SbcCD ATPase subunit
MEQQLKKLVITITILLVISIGFNTYQFIDNRNKANDIERLKALTPPANGAPDTGAFSQQLTDLQNQINAKIIEIKALTNTIDGLNKQLTGLRTRKSNGEDVQSQIDELETQRTGLLTEIQSRQLELQRLLQDYTSMVQTLSNLSKLSETIDPGSLK